MNKTIEYPWSGQIQSPNFPYDYPNNAEGQWLLKAPLGATIQITFSELEIETCSTLCTCDYVAVFDSETDEDPETMIGKYCGSARPLAITSTDRYLLINFKSDVIYGGKGEVYFCMS
jgi:cubilin